MSAQIRRFAAKLKGEPIDLLFCNAGISGKKGMAPGSFDFDSWEEVLRVNLLGAGGARRSAARQRRRQRKEDHRR